MYLYPKKNLNRSHQPSNLHNLNSLLETGNKILECFSQTNYLFKTLPYNSQDIQPQDRKNMLVKPKLPNPSVLTSSKQTPPPHLLMTLSCAEKKYRSYHINISNTVVTSSAVFTNNLRVQVHQTAILENYIYSNVDQSFSLTT